MPGGVDHQVAGFNVEVIHALGVHHVECRECLVEVVKHLVGSERMPQAREALAQRLTVDEVHHIVGGAVFLKHVVHGPNVVAVQGAQSARLLLKFFALGLEVLAVNAVTHTHVVALTVTHVEAAHKEFLYGNRLVEEGVGGLVGVAKTAARQVPLDAVLAVLQRGSYLEHRRFVDAMLMFFVFFHHYLRRHYLRCPAQIDFYMPEILSCAPLWPWAAALRNHFCDSTTLPLLSFTPISNCAWA